MRSAAPVGRVLAIVTLGAVFQVVIGLEAVYLWWLPDQRPVRPVRSAPPFVRRAIWAHLGGKGPPLLNPRIPFLVPDIASARGRPTAEATLLRLVAVRSLPRMRTREFMTRSLAVSTWLSRHWTIQELLDAYADTAYIGDDRHGFEAGARHYWGRPLDALAPHEVATLIAVSDYARLYDPACRPERALRMRATVLERMLDAKVIDDAAFRQATAAPLRVVPTCP